MAAVLKAFFFIQFYLCSAKSLHHAVLMLAELGLALLCLCKQGLLCQITCRDYMLLQKMHILFTTLFTCPPSHGNMDASFGSK